MTENGNVPARMEPGGVPGAWTGGVPQEPEEGGAGVNPKRLLHAVLRYRWIIIALAALGGAGGWYAGRFVELRYRADATVLLGSSSRQDLAQGPIQSSNLLGGSDWLSLIHSFEVLDYVSWHERLYLQHAPRDSAVFRTFSLDTAFGAGAYRLRVSRDGSRVELLTQQGTSVQAARPGDPIGGAVGFIWAPPVQALTPGRVVDFTVVTPREGALGLRRSLGLSLPRGSNFIGVSYNSGDPRRAAGVVNTTVDRFIDVATRLKNARTVELGDLLEQQLARAEENLLVADQALQSFRARTVTLPREGSALVQTPGLAETQAPVTNAYWQMKLQRDALERDRTRIAGTLDNALRDSLSVDALSTVPSVQSSPELNQALSSLAVERANMRALRQRFTDEHVQVQQKRAELDTLERKTIRELAGRVIENVNAQIGDLDRLIAAAGSEMSDIPPRVAEEWRLRREQASAERLYVDVRQRFETTRLASDATVPDLQVLDRARPPNRPVSDPRMKVLLLGVAMSLGLGLGIAILLDMMDPRLRYADQVTRGLGLTVVGAVPNLARQRRPLLGAPDSRKQVVEALRAVRLGLAHAHGAARPLLVTISSPGSGDGKTFITSNLALTFAGLGMKVLIIDGDTRRGDLHRMFQVERKPGLIDFLAGDHDTTDVLRTTEQGVHVIPGGSRTDHAPELLSSSRMGELLAWVKPRYDVILVDSPPLGAGVDPLLLGTVTGSMLLVLRTGNTERAMARQKLDMLERLPIRLLGTVLNGFDSAEGYRYYSYMPGYETSEEKEAVEGLLQPAGNP